MTLRTKTPRAAAAVWSTLSMPVAATAISPRLGVASIAAASTLTLLVITTRAPAMRAATWSVVVRG